VKVYIAAPYSKRDETIEVMQRLEERGIAVVSRWLRELDPESHAAALRDLEDVANADVLFFLQPKGWEKLGAGGRHVEMGYAIALGKEIVMFGEKSNVFHHLRGIRFIESLEDL
jgi:nucleoside 2-deoxyribosyltransferase